MEYKFENIQHLAEYLAKLAETARDSAKAAPTGTKKSGYVSQAFAYEQSSHIVKNAIFYGDEA